MSSISSGAVRSSRGARSDAGHWAGWITRALGRGSSGGSLAGRLGSAGGTAPGERGVSGGTLAGGKPDERAAPPPCDAGPERGGSGDAIRSGGVRYRGMSFTTCTGGDGAAGIAGGVSVRGLGGGAVGVRERGRSVRESWTTTWGGGTDRAIGDGELSVASWISGSGGGGGIDDG